jgi:hypothetical protein
MTTEDHMEERVRASVVESVRHLEAPDRHRLALIEQRLIEHGRRRRHGWSLWWGVLGLVAASGAAAYWAIGTDITDSPQPSPPVMEEETPSGSAGSRGAADQDREDGDNEASGERDEAGNPVIYFGQ